MPFDARSLLSLALRVARSVSSSAPTRTDTPGSGGRRRGTRATTPSPSGTARARTTAPRRTASGGVVFEYSPSADGRPDPGEIVWTWVPYEDDPHQGKDRPVLLVGREGSQLLGLMLTSRDRNNARERDDRYVDIGTGSWDTRGRPSEVKVDRLLRLDPAAIRREGAVLPRDRFDDVVTRVPAHLLD
ncbi:hypothetical protein AC792_13125 [Arthrobacter sp. RIT-PI-e]|uniref:type II toxin-antitoxin system PemK/MazF family toxin n=1 Tax=Arthrobacter sp. RIT-PI-e TaxID=1681197 RepID=UPI000676AED4|nr:type II toxin-antitoxin system PemK/MazF family toxin [Arthrobacter sp. RIT-PI-e]KNC17787.1 hypothetical protein AC792_13125 [Arthrobacter sp. RIT-PI-e]